MLNRILLTGTVLLALVAQANADLISYYDFNTLNIPTASLPGVGGVPTSIAATSGTGSLNLSTWTGTVDDFAGSTLNVSGGSVAGASLSLVAGGAAAPFPGNGSFITFQTNMTGFQDAVISFATRGTATGFNTSTWAWSTDGTTFSTVAGSTATRTTTFAVATVDFSGVTAINNASNVFFRYTVDGASSSTGNNRIDNFQINGNAFAAVPEPTSLALFGLVGGIGMVARYRRRNQKKVSNV